jgi:hypothetical protein
VWLNFPTEKKVGYGKRYQEKFAVFSGCAYEDFGDPRVCLDKHGLKSWSVIQRSRTHTTFYNSRTKQVVLAIAGTDWGVADDWVTNAGIATGNTLFHNRKRASIKYAKKLIAEYGKENVTVTGHSMGGWVATEVARATGVKAVVFNSASVGGINELYKKLMTKADITAYHTNKLSKFDIDVVSMLNPHNSDYVPRKKGLDVHTIDNFLPDEPLEGEGMNLIPNTLAVVKGLRAVKRKRKGEGYKARKSGKGVISKKRRHAIKRGTGC